MISLKAQDEPKTIHIGVRVSAIASRSAPRLHEVPIFQKP
jgi:hypothetical protein